MASRGTRPPRRFPSSWNVQEMNARKPRVSSWSSRIRRMCSTRSSMVSTWPYIIVAVVDMPSRCAWRMTSSHSAEAGVAQARERLPDGQLRAARDVLDLRRRQGVQVDRVARLDRAEEVLVVLDPEVGVVAALHQQAGAADRERLLDLLEDDRLGEEVALVAVARAPVEGAEVAVRVADVRVVQVPVDDERDAGRIGAAAAEFVRRAADRDE